MFRVFAPGAVKFFGEHAVVYGKPAIAVAIDMGIHVECQPGERLIVESVGSSMLLRYFPEERRVEAVGAEPFFSYLDTALRIAQEMWGPVKARFIIRSDLPPSVGAATSAAVSVGILKAYSLCAGVEAKMEELARLGHKVELEVQGIASPMDATAVTMGGVLKIWTNPFRVERLHVSLPQFYLVVLPRRGTTKEIVADVKTLLARRRSVSAVIEAIGHVVEEAHKCLIDGDLDCVGELMYVTTGSSARLAW
jgi:mevalonate kinase (EC 2.7.1.36)